MHNVRRIPEINAESCTSQWVFSMQHDTEFPLSVLCACGFLAADKQKKKQKEKRMQIN